MRVLFFLIFLSSWTGLMAQDIATSTVTWTVDQGNDVSAKKDFTYSSVFTTHGSTSIEWRQKDGDYNTSFTIVSSKGSWSDLSKTGKIVYSATSQDGDATLTFGRSSASGVTITLKFLQEGTEYRFRVSDISLEK